MEDSSQWRAQIPNWDYEKQISSTTFPNLGKVRSGEFYDQCMSNAKTIWENDATEEDDDDPFDLLFIFLKIWKNRTNSEKNQFVL